MQRKILGLSIAMMGFVFMACTNPTTDSSNNKQDPIVSTIVFADGSAVSKMIGSGTYTNIVSGVGTGAVTYTSGTIETATVDERTGVITLVGAGTTVITANKAATETHTTVTNTYTLTVLGIGSVYGGGKIGYILQSGDYGYNSSVPHGLIVATSDQSTSSAWITGGSTQASWVNGIGDGGTSMDLGTGQANTSAMMAQTGYTGGAATICDNYTNIETGTGIYSDWYLPSYTELLKLYINRLVISGFAAVYYWSSSEGGAYNANGINFGAYPGNIDKGTLCYVRPVRSF